MTRRRILTVEQADKAMESLGWLKTMGHPNAAVRELFECATVYRAAVHRQETPDRNERPGFAERVEKQRN
jgi:hypothetical protein